MSILIWTFFPVKCDIFDHLNRTPSCSAFICSFKWSLFWYSFSHLVHLNLNSSCLVALCNFIWSLLRQLVVSYTPVTEHFCFSVWIAFYAKPFFLSPQYRSNFQSWRGPPSAILMTQTTQFNVRREGRPQAQLNVWGWLLTTAPPPHGHHTIRCQQHQAGARVRMWRPLSVASELLTQNQCGWFTHRSCIWSHNH